MDEGFPKEQLQMVWPEEAPAKPPEVSLPTGYGLRTYRSGDDGEFVRLMRLAGFADWTDDSLRAARRTALPDGIFFVVHEKTGAIVATAMATHNPTERHPFGGELGWVAAHPDHRGRGLGRAVCAAALRRFQSAGYRRIYLKTDDWRLPAIKTYLKLGFVPFLHAPDMEERWRSVCGKLGWKPLNDAVEVPGPSARGIRTDRCGK